MPVDGVVAAAGCFYVGAGQPCVARDDIDDAPHRLIAEEHARASADDLDTLDLVHRNAVQRGCRYVGAVVETL